MLVDFGIAKVSDPKLKTTLGAHAVTPGYSPLEQYGMGTTDARTDIYALGVVMYLEKWINTSRQRTTTGGPN